MLSLQVMGLSHNGRNGDKWNQGNRQTLSYVLQNFGNYTINLSSTILPHLSPTLFPLALDRQLATCYNIFHSTISGQPLLRGHHQIQQWAPIVSQRQKSQSHIKKGTTLKLSSFKRLPFYQQKKKFQEASLHTWHCFPTYTLYTYIHCSQCFLFLQSATVHELEWVFIFDICIFHIHPQINIYLFARIDVYICHMWQALVPIKLINEF